MTTTALNELLAFLFGRKYYANIVGTRGTDRTEICSYIFHSRAEADHHRATLDTTRSFLWLETISFRSRREY